MAGLLVPGKGEIGRLRRFVPPGRHLFATFAVPAAAVSALDQARAMPALGVEELSVFEGEAGRAQIDPYMAVEGRLAIAFRLFIWVFSTNVEYLHGLSEAVAQGLTVVAVKVRDQHAADQVARLLATYGGQSFAYATHGNYVPVML